MTGIRLALNILLWCTSFWLGREVFMRRIIKKWYCPSAVWSCIICYTASKYSDASFCPFWHSLSIVMSTFTAIVTDFKWSKTEIPGVPIPLGLTSDHSVHIIMFSPDQWEVPESTGPGFGILWRRGLFGVSFNTSQAFSVEALQLWNAVLGDLRFSSSLMAFQGGLKTFLFHLAFDVDMSVSCTSASTTCTVDSLPSSNNFPPQKYI